MFRRIVDRCSVNESDRAVIKYVISRLKNGYGTWRALDQKTRKQYMREVIAIHRENQNLYISIMTGNFK